MGRIEAISRLAADAAEPGRATLAEESGEYARVHPKWEDVHRLPCPVFVTAGALREFAVADLLREAGRAYRAADPGYRDVVGFEARRPSGRPGGAVVATRGDRIEGRYHVVALDREAV